MSFTLSPRPDLPPFALEPLPQELQLTNPGFDVLLGQVIDGRYRVLEPIGGGGMGRVYRAVQLELDRPVALKVVHATDPAFRDRFLFEASLTSKLRHPNTVTVFDYGCTPAGTLYLVMEYLEGQTLAELVCAQGALPWQRVLGIGQQIGRAVREAHQLGVVHRDIKPANVMLLSTKEDHDVVRVLDFGLVKSFDRERARSDRALTEQGLVMGSPLYLAPEQVQHHPVDPRSDIYSLGVVLYEALCGTPPFRGRYDLDVLLKHVNDPVPPLPAKVPAAVRRLVMRCLEKDPAARFQTMEELLVAMSNARDARSKLLRSVVFLGATLGIAGAGVLAGRLTAGTKVESTPQALLHAAVPAVTRPERVQFSIDSQPSGARVMLQGKTLGTTPVKFDLPPGADGVARAELLLTRRGYLPLTVAAGGTGPHIELVQKLQRAKTSKRPSRVHAKRARVKQPPSNEIRRSGKRRASHLPLGPPPQAHEVSPVGEEHQREEQPR
ncbi:MAG: serine/threonine-protein kinase [Myxococcota bacterium]